MILASLLHNYPRIGDTADEQVLRRALLARDQGASDSGEVAAAEEEMTRRALREQADAGLDILTDGLVRWHDPVSHVARGLQGFRVEGLLRYFDTNTYYRQPAAVGRIGRAAPFLVDAWRFAAAAAAPRPVKAIVTGPVTLARLSRDARGTGRRDLALAIASALNREILDLEAAGAPIVQVDEPALARFPGDRALLPHAMRRLVAGLTRARVLLATSFGDAIALAADLAALPAALLGFDVTVTGPETGDRLAGAIPPGTGLLLGVIDGRNTRPEDPDQVYATRLRPILEALRPAGAREIHLAPNHGLEFLPRDAARAKMAILAALRDRARREHA